MGYLEILACHQILDTSNVILKMTSNFNSDCFIQQIAQTNFINELENKIPDQGQTKLLNMSEPFLTQIYMLSSIFNTSANNQLKHTHT